MLTQDYKFVKLDCVTGDILQICPKLKSLEGTVTVHTHIMDNIFDNTL